MSVWAVLPAAGRGQRMQAASGQAAKAEKAHCPKQYLPLHGATVIEHSLQRLLAVAEIRQVLVALSPEDQHFESLAVAKDARISPVVGGEQRYQSVLNALLQLPDVANSLDKRNAPFSKDDWVLVHDAVRPCVRSEDVHKLLAELQDHPVGGLLGAPVEHTLKQVEQGEQTGGDGETETIAATIDRSQCRYAFTPQMFRYGLLCESLEAAIKRGIAVTDESSAVEALGHRPRIVAGSSDNIKITYESDLHLATAILQQQESAT